jgi:cytochrome c
MAVKRRRLVIGLMSLAICAGLRGAEAGDVAYGEYLASECVTCHQRSGAAHGTPAIVGWPQDQFVAVLNSYRWKERDNPVMQTIAGKLTDEDIEALAAYFESIDPAKTNCNAKPQPLSC